MVSNLQIIHLAFLFSVILVIIATSAGANSTIGTKHRVGGING